MKIRIKFSKQGAVKFVGHLDILRYFQKAMRRADVDIRYSEGFSPHQVMSFAAPLGVGLTSNGEYMDIEVLSSASSAQMVDRLNQVMAEGITVKSFLKLDDSAKNAMSQVAAADYTVMFREESRPQDMDSFADKLMEFYHRDTIEIVKTTKKGEKVLDIKPLIYQLSVKGQTISMQLATGSANNLKPETVMEAFFHSLGADLLPFALMVQREEVYTEEGKEGSHSFKALEEYGTEIK